VSGMELAALIASIGTFLGAMKASIDIAEKLQKSAVQSALIHQSLESLKADVREAIVHHESHDKRLSDLEFFCSKSGFTKR
jgi:hypothetical protein